MAVGKKLSGKERERETIKRMKMDKVNVKLNVYLRRISELP